MKVSVLGQHPRIVDEEVEASIPNNGVNLKRLAFTKKNLEVGVVMYACCVGMSGRMATLYIVGWDYLVDNARIAACVGHIQLQRLESRSGPCKL